MFRVEGWGDGVRLSDTDLCAHACHGEVADIKAKGHVGVSDPEVQPRLHHPAYMDAGAAVTAPPHSADTCRLVRVVAGLSIR